MDGFECLLKKELQVEGLNGGLNEGLKSLLEYYKNNPGKKAKDAEIELKRSIKTIERQIKILIEKNLY